MFQSKCCGSCSALFFQSELWETYGKKTPHSSFESAANLNPRRVTCACRGISSTGPLARTWGCCLWLGTLRKWWLIGLENSEIQPQSPWKSKPLLPLIEKPESRIRRIAKRPTATSEHMTRAVTLTYPNWLPNTCDWSVNSLAVAPFHLMVKKTSVFRFPMKILGQARWLHSPLYAVVLSLLLSYIVIYYCHIYDMINIALRTKNLGSQALWSSRHLPSRQSPWPVQRSCGNQAWYSVGKTQTLPRSDCDNLKILCIIYDNVHILLC